MPTFSQVTGARLHRQQGFTLMEVLISAALFCMLGLIIYGVASEGLFAFSRNISVNRSYMEARRSLDRIGLALQTAGYTPVLTDATGLTTTASPAAGIRFWRNSSTPVYNLTTPTLTSKTLTLSLLQPGSTTLTEPAPVAGDLITVPAIGFQASVVSVTAAGTSATLTFANTVAANSSSSITSIPTTTTQITKSGTSTVTIQYSCVDWIPTAFITVGTQLRYYPRFIYGTTSLSTAANYRLLTNLLPAVPANKYTSGQTPTTAAVTATPTLPFSYGAAPSINVGIYGQAPDYSNNTNVSSANTYTYLQCAFSSRNPSLLTSPP